MKNTIFRLSALLIVLVMLLTLLIGCTIPDGSGDGEGSSSGTGNDNEDSSGSGDGGSTDDSTVTDPTEITTKIYEIAKHGNLILYMYGKDLYDKGYQHGDVVKIAIGDKEWNVPLCTSYSDVDNGMPVLRAIADTDGVVLALNMGDFATTAGIAQKTAIDEDPGYRWDYLSDSPIEIKITMKEKAGYRDEWLIRQLVRTNERTDYPHLSDEAFANFRVIETAGMGKGILYRSSSPINPYIGRNTYADKAAEKAGIITVVNLADNSNIYEGTENSYYSTCQVVYVNLGMDFLSESTLDGIAEGMRFIIDNDGPYLIHCNEGKDRAGFVSALLECLMGATLDEVIDDYMLTYYNYYGVEEGTEKYNAVVKNNLIKSLNTTFKVDDVYKADLVAEAEAFLIEEAGLSADEVAALKANLGISIEEVYEAGKDLSSLLGDHESVYVEVTSNGTLLQEYYLCKQYSYFFYDSEYMNLGFDYSALITDHSQYNCYDGDYSYIVLLDQSGVIDMETYFAGEGATSFISDALLNAEDYSITEKDGYFIVSCHLDLDEILTFDDTIVSCVETYTLDAATRKMTSVKTVYTHKDGTVEEGTVTITRDVEAPEGAKPFIAYEQTENLRTITIVSNPGTEGERTDVIRTPKGLQVSFSPDWSVDNTFGAYTDAACTNPIPETPDTNSDVTVYIKWDEIRYTVTPEEWAALVNEKNYTWKRIENGEILTIQKYTEYAFDIDGHIFLIIDDKVYSLVEEEDGWYAYDCTDMEFEHNGLMEGFEMSDFEYDETKQAYLYKYWEEDGYKLEVRFKNGIQTSLTIIDVNDESNVAIRLVSDVGTTVIDIPEDYTIVEDDYEAPVYSAVTEEQWNSFVGETNFNYTVMIMGLVGSDFYTESHNVQSVGNAISVDGTIYVLEDGKYYVLEEATDGWIARESKLPAFCLTSLLDGLSYNDFEFDEESGYYVQKEALENEPYFELVFNETGFLLAISIYNNNLSEAPETEGADLSAVIGFNSIGSTVIDIPEYTIAE